MFVDVHSHLYFPQFDKDRKDVIERAKSSDVKAVINAGTNHDSNLKVLELSKKYDIVKATLGIYPTAAMNLSTKELKEEIEFIRSKSKEIIGIGEIGLDFHLTKKESDHNKQIEAFKEILTSLKDLNKTFVIHSRKAEAECIDILEELKVKKVVFHCFCGKVKLLKRIEDNGWTISIPANIDKSQQFQLAVEKMSINNLLTETDAPFLAPRDKERSEPAFVVSTIKKIAEIKKITQEEAKKNIFFNYQKLFS
jgi:TatD DNase family protein